MALNLHFQYDIDIFYYTHHMHLCHKICAILVKRLCKFIVLI